MRGMSLVVSSLLATSILFIDESQIVDVDGYFGIVHGFGHGHNLLFGFKLCHKSTGIWFAE